jgi:hypothetical protein
MTEPTTPAQAVTRGAALLDREFPGWAERIDLPTLDLGDCYQCILGQLFEEAAELYSDGYLTGRDRLGLTFRDTVEHGFIPRRDSSGYDDLLNEAWAAEVLRRVPA